MSFDRRFMMIQTDAELVCVSLNRGCTGFDGSDSRSLTAGEVVCPPNGRKLIIAETNDNYALAA